MELAPVNVELTFEVTFSSPGLPVAMSVYDTSGGSPVLIQGPTAMPLVHGNTYMGKFTPVVEKPYVVIKAVYTDGSFTTLDPDYSQGSESIIAQTLGGGGGGSTVSGCAVIGLVDSNTEVLGFVQC